MPRCALACVRAYFGFVPPKRFLAHTALRASEGAQAPEALHHIAHAPRCTAGQHGKICQGRAIHSCTATRTVKRVERTTGWQQSLLLVCGASQASRFACFLCSTHSRRPAQASATPIFPECGWRSYRRGDRCQPSHIRGAGMGTGGGGAPSTGAAAKNSQEEPKLLDVSGLRISTAAAAHGGGGRGEVG